MLKASYKNLLNDDPMEMRRREHVAFHQLVAGLEHAQKCGKNSPQFAEAIFFAEKMWLLLIDDLASEANRLPESLRASLISIGIWVSKEITSVRADSKSDLSGLIEVNKIIRDGLC